MYYSGLIYDSLNDDYLLYIYINLTFIISFYKGCFYQFIFIK